MGCAGHRDAGHQHHRGRNRVRGCHSSRGRPTVRRHLRTARPEGADHMTETAIVQKGVDTAQFVSRRNLVLRRFLRNESAVVALILVVVLFVGCYALPPFLPYSYTDLDYSALQEPPSAEHL